MKEKRRDSKGRILHTGESQRTDGKYLYKYVDAFGNTKYVYAWRLTPTDPTPKGKRDKPSLRELEQQIRRDIEDGIDSTGKKMTLCQLYAKQNTQRANVKKSTQKQREQLMRLLKEDKLGARSIDLSQAEAVIDIINARNDYALKSSVNQLGGRLSEKITAIREVILDNVAFIESALDDPEHFDINDNVDKMTKDVDNCVDKVDKLLKTSDNGRIMRDGIRTVILGKTNAGKSSLLNALAKEERAIVTDIEGTTRDVLEEQINLSGITLNLIDTAGIRKTDDYVENIGVNKAKKYASEADLIIFVIDASRPLDNNDYEIMDLIMNKKVLVLLNKSDIQAVVTKEDILKHLSCNVISVSAKEETGIDDLETEIKNMFFNGEIETNEEIYITNLRHKNLLREALESLKLVKGGIEAGVSEDFLTIDMMNAYEKLGLIIGEEVEDDLADRIFEKFCMGK